MTIVNAEPATDSADADHRGVPNTNEMAGPVGGLLKLGTMHTKQPKLNTKTHTANRNLLANVKTFTTNKRPPIAAPHCRFNALGCTQPR